jgi:nucleoside-diphosphate-sugar epimerase
MIGADARGIIAEEHEMQTILGAGGAIGTDLAKVLLEYTDRVRLVGRHPRKIVPENEPFAADLTSPSETTKAVEGSEVAYLLAGLPYKKKVWQAQWPLVMRNAIDACRAARCKLVFFDNIYMYDRNCLSAMNEDTPVRPTSVKGAVRAEIASTLSSAIDDGDLEGLIARSADFYGPGRQAGSILTQMVFERLAAGKPAQWLLSADCKHSFTYTPDAARGVAMLGNAPDAYGEVWHLPTDTDPPTGREWVEAIAAELGVEPRLQVATNAMLSMIGVFIPALRELKELVYQYDRNYVFDSAKFNERFDFTPTAYSEGIKAIVQSDYRGGNR